MGVRLLDNQTTSHVSAVRSFRSNCFSPVNCASLATMELSSVVTHFWFRGIENGRFICHIVVVLEHLAPYLLYIFLTFYIVLVVSGKDEAWLCLRIMTKNLELNCVFLPALRSRSSYTSPHALSPRRNNIWRLFILLRSVVENSRRGFVVKVAYTEALCSTLITQVQVRWLDTARRAAWMTDSPL